MWLELSKTLLRRLALFIVGLIIGNSRIASFLGPDVLAFLQRNEFITELVTSLIGVVLLLWSMKDKIIERVRLKKAIALPRHTTVEQVKAEVKDEANVIVGVTFATSEQTRDAYQQTPIRETANH